MIADDYILHGFMTKWLVFVYIAYFNTIHLQLDSSLHPLIITCFWSHVRPMWKNEMRGKELAILEFSSFLLPLKVYQAILSSILRDIHI